MAIKCRISTGQTLSEDLPLQDGEFLPTQTDGAAGAVDDARPHRWGERVMRLLDRPPRLSTLEYLFFSGDDRFGALGVSTSSTEYLPRRYGPLPTLRDVPAMHELVRRVEAGEPCGYPELALLLRRRGAAENFEAQGEQLFRRMVFNILIDNTDDHEKNHVLLVNANQRYRPSPAFDMLPSGQALGYQQMRVGSDGADSTMDNAMSEHRAFALIQKRAQAICAEVAGVVAQWRSHFKSQEVSKRDMDLLARRIDREFLGTQRDALA